MKCNHCGSEWKTNASISASITVCPFCHEEIGGEASERWQFFDTTQELLAYVVKKYGVDALLGRLHFSDHISPLMPQRQKNMLKQAFDCGAVKILQDNIDTDQQHKEIAVKQAVGKLVDTYASATEAAEQIILEFTIALGWGVALEDQEQQDRLMNEALIYHSEGNYKAAYDIVTMLVKQKHPRALNMLGLMYENGHFVEKDLKQAFELYRKSASLGSPYGKNNVGKCYFYGLYVEADKEKGIKIIKELADLDFYAAQEYLAHIYLYGQYGEKDETKAFQLYVKASKSDSWAMYKTATMLIWGVGTLKDEKRGIQLLKQASKDGNKDSAAYLKTLDSLKALQQDPAFRYSAGINIDSVMEDIHLSLQDRINVKRTVVAAQAAKQLIASANKASTVSVAQVAAYKLLLAHIAYLKAEAPPDEQNIFTLVCLLDLGMADTYEQSDTDKLYEQLKEKNPNHTALSLYNEFNTISCGYASKAIAIVRQLFSFVGSSTDVYKNITSQKECYLLSDVLAYSFCTLTGKQRDKQAESDWDKWKSDYNGRLLKLRTFMNSEYSKYDRNKSPVSFSLLLSSAPNPVAKKAIAGCCAFYRSVESNDNAGNVVAISSAVKGATRIKVGNIHHFGKYDWRVLAIQNDSVLLISTDVTNVNIPYNNEKNSVTWESCTLRKWLNEEFLLSFTHQEQAQIVTSLINNENNQWESTSGGSDTKDKVFLLSISEVVKYFGDSGDLGSRRRKDYNGLETSYGNLLNDQYSPARMARYNGNAVWWWLRSPGRINRSAARVSSEGHIDLSGSNVQLGGSSGGVRPAIWINL